MKIIKEGKLPEKDEFIHTCPNCKTIYEFVKGECKFSSSPKNESYYVVECPFCKQKNYIDCCDMPRLKKKKGNS